LKVGKVVTMLKIRHETKQGSKYHAQRR